VHFYEDDAIFIESLSEFVGSALGAGGACLVIATDAHHRSLANSLRANFIDTLRSASEGRYIALDAGDTLSQFMVKGHPDPALFRDTIEPVLRLARQKLRRDTGALAAFGEMVALLWAEGNREAAIELEHLWNDLALRHKFDLRCGYPLGCFSSEGHAELFRQMCEEHSEVVPSESFTSLDSQDARMRLISSLQQKASTMEAAVEEREKEVAHRRDVEERLRRTEEFTRNIIESSTDCVKVFDLEGRIQYMSPAGQRALEITDANEYLNKPWLEFWASKDQKSAADALTAARSGGVGCFQGDFTTPSGARKSWDVRISPALGRNGEIERLVAVSRDITELRSAQQLAIQAEKLAAAGRLAATIAHEINNPLEAVTNFIYLAMTAKGLPEEVCRHLEIADRELARVAQIAQQTLGFYRDNSKDRWISVADLIRDVLVVYERKLAYKHLETEVSVDSNLRLRCKQGELRQALSNLIANAIDASKNGGRIWLRVHEAKRWKDGEPGVRITLADNGGGMSQEVQKRIFVPFFTTKAEIGTGIGLWASRTLIEQQGGCLRFRSRQGAKPGTVMSIFLPNARSHQALKQGSP
jgi:PAS domain S-box-containing protein